MGTRALEETIRAGHLSAWLADLADGSETERWLCRALRRDLALLSLRPELLPCVYRLEVPKISGG